MIAFEVTLNGKRLVVAGRDDLSVLSARLTARGALGSASAGVLGLESEYDVSFRVIGGPPGHGHLTWAEKSGLSIGDEIVLKVVGTAASDPSRQAHSATSITVECSFCGTKLDEVEDFVAAAGAAICNECVPRCNEILVERKAKRPPEGPLRCSFCGNQPDEAADLVTGQSNICSSCVALCSQVLADRKRLRSPKELHQCSFCGKKHDEVEKLIAGPDVNICNECVDLCRDIVAEDRARRAPEGLLECAFCGKTNREVAIVITSPKANICNECVAVCSDVVAKRKRGDGSGDEKEE